MIVVKLELWPRGDETKARPLGTVLIANDGTGTPTSGNYSAMVTKAGTPRDKLWKEIPIFRFPRKRLTAYDLLYRVLRVAVGARNEDAK